MVLKTQLAFYYLTMWRYIAAAVLFFVGAIEILLALHRPLREEIMKNSLLPLTRAAPLYLFLAGISAFAMALGILFYNRFL